MKTTLLLTTGCLILGLLGVASEAKAQEVVGPVAAAPVPVFEPHTLFKLGVTPTRWVPQYRYNGFQFRISPSIGLERQLTSAATIYALAEVDFLTRRGEHYIGGKEALVHTGAVGIGGRYYYNQAGRERHQRARGSFVGNYVALEAMTELDRRQLIGVDDNGNIVPAYQMLVMPLLNAYWGLQRRPGKHFLYDINTGVGIIARPVDKSFYTLDSPQQYRLQGDFAINIRLYYVR
jgi:hypothetical protein